ncbi:metallophosphoesterase family protein [Macrococcus equipercicus]|uniref:Phosphoesterase n=1 Tax=Macrococcus equipercicus TaxID=69967 RepID=A0A9Q9BS16_9STAP|nr:metallophosphoesterase [Macrococcus equipercicus]KAA1039978.1 metallophosphoesterase [Macrococcus equipercicus]UTH13089.1 metallophosphoesterase [Macrococcus equipercicus]
MKWVIVSDNHGEEVLRDIQTIHDDADLWVHLGDSEFDYHAPELKHYTKVAGNCDYGADFKDEQLIQYHDINAYMTHGHKLSVNRGLKQLAARAAEHQCSIAFYGHTHVRHVETVDGVVCINPGSISQSRSADPESYAVITFDETEKVITFLNERHEIMDKEVLVF